MGWLESLNAKKKDKVPKIFENKSEDDILKMLEDASRDKETIQSLNARVAEQDTTVDKIKTEFETVKARLVAAEAKGTPPPKKEPTEEHNFVEHPSEAFAEHVAPIANIAIQNAAITARILAQQQLDNADMASGGKSMDGRLFRAWSMEIDNAAKKYPTIQLGSPDSWIGIYFHLKGLHADELSNPEIRKKKYNFMEPAASSSDNSRQEDNSNKPAADQLTPAELHVAEKMKVTPENYLKQKKAMKFVNA